MPSIARLSDGKCRLPVDDSYLTIAVFLTLVGSTPIGALRRLHNSVTVLTT